MRERMSRSVSRRILSITGFPELRVVFLVANEQGSFTTPSFVSFTDEERLIGESAKNQAAMNPANTIFDIKYDRGRDFGNLQLTFLQATYRAKIRRPDSQKGY